MPYTVIAAFIDKRSGRRIEPGAPLPEDLGGKAIERLVRARCVVAIAPPAASGAETVKVQLQPDKPFSAEAVRDLAGKLLEAQRDGAAVVFDDGISPAEASEAPAPTEGTGEASAAPVSVEEPGETSAGPAPAATGQPDAPSLFGQSGGGDAPQSKPAARVRAVRRPAQASGQ